MFSLQLHYTTLHYTTRRIINFFGDFFIAEKYLLKNYLKNIKAFSYANLIQTYLKEYYHE